MKKFNTSINILVLIIIVLALAACLMGLFSSGGIGQYEFQSINNETVKIFGEGIYKNDSISAMIINMALKGVDMNLVEIFIFPVFNLVALICLMLLLKNTKKQQEDIA